MRTWGNQEFCLGDVRFEMPFKHLSRNVHKQLGTLFWGVKEGSWEEGISV